VASLFLGGKFKILYCAWVRYFEFHSTLSNCFNLHFIIYLQLESNLISPHVAPPSTVNRNRETDWVKISEAPPLVVNTRLGERVEIECEALGSPAPHIQWLRGERIVSQVRTYLRRTVVH